VRREFYVSVAHLFYAVATIDKNFAKQEKKTIVELVEQYFSQEIDHEQSTEIIYQTLRFLIQKEFTADEAYQKFVKYFEFNKEQFDDQVLHKILVTCHEIADSFSSKNKSELILLARIQALLKTI
jgi:LPS O-antigen subunit length determinant protein (WzzB/FepE family)